MNRFDLVKGVVLAAVMTLAGAAQAATFVYVSNAEDGTSACTRCRPTARCSPGRVSRRERR